MMSRILLLIDQRENRRLLAEAMEPLYETLEGDAALRQHFDLCIIDSHALSRLSERVRMRKHCEQNLFLPFLLVTHKHGFVTRQMWESVDESISIPIVKAELQARIQMLLRVRMLTRENTILLRQLEAELERAARIQAELLPQQSPVLNGFELSAKSLAAREVGGDFYDWQMDGPEKLIFTVGDAMGRGMPAALLMATVRAALRAVTRRHSPGPALELVRNGLESDLVHASGFVTVFHAQLHTGSRRLLYVDAGHAHLFIRHADGHTQKLQPPSPALGIPSSKPFREAEFVFSSGDALVVYTDGLIDSQPDVLLNESILAERVGNCSTAAAMVENLLALAEEPGGQPDDVTVAVLRCL